jgi:hypothetical protein
LAVDLGCDQSKMDIRRFTVYDRHACQHLLKALWPSFDADAREAPAQPSCPPAAKNLTSHLQVIRELTSFVAAGVRRGRHKWNCRSVWARCGGLGGKQVG